MSRQEIQSAINQILENTPDSVLNEVLDYLNAVKKQSEQTVVMSQNHFSRRQRTSWALS